MSSPYFTGRFGPTPAGAGADRTDAATVRGVNVEIVGRLPAEWRNAVAVFVTQAERHRWGGPGPERLVVADNIPTALERWMKPDAWCAKREQDVQMVGSTAAKAFAARR